MMLPRPVTLANGIIKARRFETRFPQSWYTDLAVRPPPVSLGFSATPCAAMWAVNRRPLLREQTDPFRLPRRG